MRPPYFWNAGLDPRSREAAPLTRALLTPLAALYSWGVQRKIRNARPMRAGIPVICIGNLTSGGAGKSPVVAAIREHFTTKGLRAASLSRGYGGRLSGPLEVEPDKHAARDVGDEPLMLAASGESWIGADRPAAARAMADAGVQLVIMDDGHQNPSLHKDMSLVVIDAEAPFGNGHVIPKGPLREPVTAGLSRAHAVILMGTGEIPEAVASAELTVLQARLKPTTPPPAGPLVAFAGIGRPAKFFDSLRATGAELAEEVPFADHHRYTSSDMAYLRRLADERQAILITTLKDHVRLTAEQQAGVSVFPVEAVFDSPDALGALLASVTESMSA